MWERKLVDVEVDKVYLIPSCYALSANDLS